MSNRLNQERESKLQPKRMDYAKRKISELGLEIFFENETEIRFYHNNHVITLFPYSGWFTGIGIKDGRGIKNLLRQIEVNNEN